MPILHLISIKCYEQEDTLGDDLAYLFVNGQKVWRQYMDTNQSRPINTRQVFRRRAILKLYDQDGGYNAGGGDDDFLGRHEVIAAEAGQGVRTATFAEDDAHYKVWYEVLAVPRGGSQADLERAMAGE